MRSNSVVKQKNHQLDSNKKVNGFVKSLDIQFIEEMNIAIINAIWADFLCFFIDWFLLSKRISLFLLFYYLLFVTLYHVHAMPVKMFNHFGRHHFDNAILIRANFGIRKTIICFNKLLCSRPYVSWCSNKTGLWFGVAGEFLLRFPFVFPQWFYLLIQCGFEYVKLLDESDLNHV